MKGYSSWGVGVLLLGLLTGAMAQVDSTANEVERQTTTIRGRVVAKADQTPLWKVRVFTRPRTVAAETDSLGWFELKSDLFVADTSYALVFVHGEYKPTRIRLDPIHPGRVHRLQNWIELPYPVKELAFEDVEMLQLAETAAPVQEALASRQKLLNPVVAGVRGAQAGVRSSPSEIWAGYGAPPGRPRNTPISRATIFAMCWGTRGRPLPSM